MSALVHGASPGSRMYADVPHGPKGHCAREMLQFALEQFEKVEIELGLVDG